MRVIKKSSGLVLAIAAASLVGCAAMTDSKPAGSAELVHCHGVNKCGGHNDCKSTGNACAGKASCKGTGFVKITAKACGDVGGTVK
ncbi:MAG: hypothetical protein A6F71_08205 [Cycloclasticus sp. symbiont of Poecilosclerida sp. M]|nr:MAG: hypothetical protein A6F71_08205 [Cycloclasticus sp. symbiont of Poecilosclerida sp. M]